MFDYQDELFDHGNTGRRPFLLQLIANWNTPDANKEPEESVNREIEEAYRGYSLNPKLNISPVHCVDTGSTQILS